MPRANPQRPKKGTSQEEDEEKKTYDCHECGMTYSCRQSLFRHKSEQHGTTTFKCPECSYKNFRPIRILEHTKRNHPKKTINKENLIKISTPPVNKSHASNLERTEEVSVKRRRICRIESSDEEETDEKDMCVVVIPATVSKPKEVEEMSFEGGATQVLNIPVLEAAEERDVIRYVDACVSEKTTSSCQTDGEYKMRNMASQTGSRGSRMVSVASQTDRVCEKGVNESTQVKQSKAITRFLTYDDGSTETIHEAIWADDKEKHIAETIEEEGEEEYDPLDDAELDRKLNELYHPTKIAVVSPLKKKKPLEDLSNIFETESDAEE